MNDFNRRTYDSFCDFITDFRIIMSKRDQMKLLMRGDLIDSDFRERLMLAVTAVNGCRFCSYAHTKKALEEGVSDKEIEALHRGEFANSPVEELPALLYAQHWAETGGNPESKSREKIVEQYGEDTLASIELALRTIQMGNLTWNTIDYLLFRVSSGRWGVTHKKDLPN